MKKEQTLFSKRISLRLAELGWTQTELAELLNVNKSSVSSAMKAGKTPMPRTIKRYANVLDVPVGYLMDDEFFNRNGGVKC